MDAANAVTEPAQIRPNRMTDLSSPKLLYLKALLFLVFGAGAAALLILDRPDVRTCLLVALTVWAFARVYYFCFYVIERYVDPSFRFSGLVSVAVHLLRSRKVRRNAHLIRSAAARVVGGREPPLW